MKLAQSGHKSTTQIARDLGMADRRCAGGVNGAAEHGEQAFPGSGHQLPHEEELRRLQRENDLLRQERDIFKKSAGHLLAQPVSAFRSSPSTASNTDHGALQNVKVSESDYYAWKSREPSQHCREDARLSADIQHIFVEHRQVYGSPRIHAVLKARGIACGRKRVVRLMQQLGLSAQTKKRRKPTTQSSPGGRFAPNQLNREFAASVPNQKWVTDTTAVETAEGWLYLAVILDLFSRMVVGWAMAATEDGQLVGLALRMALAT